MRLCRYASAVRLESAGSHAAWTLPYLGKTCPAAESPFLPALGSFLPKSPKSLTSLQLRSSHWNLSVGLADFEPSCKMPSDLLNLACTADEHYLAYHPSSVAAAAIYMVTHMFCSDDGLEAVQAYMRDLNIEVCSLPSVSSELLLRSAKSSFSCPFNHLMRRQDTYTDCCRHAFDLLCSILGEAGCADPKL